jgi:Ca-activated chloride channel homolog
MIEFENPLLNLLLLFIPLMLVWYLKKGRHREATMRYSAVELIPQKSIKYGSIKIWILNILQLLIITLIIIALARPRLINTEDVRKKDIIEIMLVIDQSSSMLAQDFQPDRLGAAREVARSFIQKRDGDRVGVIVFAGNSFIQCPLTTDMDILDNLTEQIQIASREYDGTNIGEAIATAINRLRFSDENESKVKSKIIILLSDGSNNEGELDPLKSAQLAKEMGIKIYTIAVGTHGYAPYPRQDIFGNVSMQQTLVEVDEETLKEIANITGGQFDRATDNEKLQSIYDDIDKLERTEVEVTEYQSYTDLYSWLTIPAALLSLLYFILSKGVFRRLIS